MSFKPRLFRVVARRSLVVLLLAMLPPLAIAAEEEKPKAPYGLDRRIAWTTSRVVGSPDPPPPLRAVRAFAKLSFANPLYLIADPKATGPGESTANAAEKERLFVVEQHGKILAFPNDSAVEQAVPFLSLDDRDAYGMTFHPDYAKNRFVYVFSNGPNSAA